MWKKIFIFIFLYAFTTTAQTTSIGDLEFEPADTLTGPYKVTLSQPCLFIDSGFASDQIAQTGSLDSVSYFLIKEIVLVYSLYHKAENFNQSKLNDSRWNNLIKSYPSMFLTGTTRYRNVCQNGSKSDTNARKLTHGFYIYFENRSDSAKRVSEISEISKMIQALGIDTSETAEAETRSPVPSDEVIPAAELKKKHSKFKQPMHTVDPKACRQAFYRSGLEDLNLFFKEKVTLTKRQKRDPKTLNAEVRLRLSYNGFIKSAYIMAKSKALVEQIRKSLYEMEPWNPAIRNGVTIKSDVKFNLQYSAEGIMVLKGGITVAQNLAKCGTATDEELFDFSKKEMKEKMIPTVFEVPDNFILRHLVERQPALDSLLLVVDLTASMGPYIAQVLDLMADLVISDDPHVSCITMFNDGDAKLDKNKQIGKTGGIITLRDEITLDRLGKAVMRSMKRGTGGDCMENDLEAVLKGLNECKDCRDVVIIADNFATPRDGALVTSINKPIHWVLCGASEGINVHYLDLIRSNKGFLHTLNSDVANLHLLNENETISIDGNSYRLKNGKFKFVNIL